MGVAYFPELEAPIAGFDPATAMDGKELARTIEELDERCRALMVPPLTAFYSESPEEAFAKIDVDLNRTSTAQDAGEHGDALLRKGIGQVLDVRPASPLQGHKL